MADSNADKIAQIKAFQQQQEANGAKQRELKKQAFEAPEGPQRDALLAQRDQLRQENKDIDARIQQVAPDNAANAIYEGPDRNSGQHTYVNPVTGQRFVAPDAPSDAQKSNSLPFDANQSNKAQQTAIEADNKAAQQGYAGAPQPAATAPASENKATPLNQEGINTTVATGTDSGVTVGGPIADSAGQVTQTPLDDGSDPYVSNGQTTIAPIAGENQQTVDSEPSTVPLQESLGPGEELVPISASEDAALNASEQQAVDEAAANDAAARANDSSEPSPKGNYSTAGSVDQVRAAPTLNTPRNQKAKDDWRVRLSLPPTAKYLYKDPSIKPTDLLYPLVGTDGVIFPYMPQINTSYKANYDPSDLTHSNYKSYFYKNSSVEDISITAEFTAQDTAEANYMLAVLHFFKSATKMFYGQDGKDGGPRSGTPPPICFLNGLGLYNFNQHPVLISSFSYNFPNDVDYLRAGSTAVLAGQNTLASTPKQSTGFFDSIKARLSGSKLNKGAMPAEPNFQSLSNSMATYVPTKISITLSLLPVVTRSDISNRFSLQDYAKGKLLNGSQNKGRGIW